LLGGDIPAKITRKRQVSPPTTASREIRCAMSIDTVSRRVLSEY